ncbi:HAMP domain-containing sensor histidine kinase [Brevibacillus centrosporus]|uniref:sensor histidine kinase n=1 Tax=Brevibacillus centrosporus TaxID=54910 RepID=UPI000F0A987F|nr:HAMP domain-containing sensor histidine kinase [Brevibacillus centrosporus]MEC2127479.1 HAMP domain-containing sensor histidine kinase [Brevibacillus centrosporus]RNB67891.1 GHKL domain-containing protein [Brevibacillus centrosporus]GED30129.1 two-component sensor histidine kinase [Brevibacillus centrosporus]
MDTKLKNKSYSLLATLALLVTTTLSFLTVADLYDKREYLQEDYYFDSYNFFDQLNTEVDLIRSVHVEFAGYEQKKPLEKIDVDTLERITHERDQSLKDDKQSIVDHYNALIQEAQQAGKTEDVAKLTTERDSKISEKYREIQSEWDKRISQFVKDKDQEYEERKNSLAFRDSSFKYYVVDGKRNKVYTNLGYEPSDAALQRDALYSFQFPKNSHSRTNMFADLNRSFQLNQWKGVIYVPKSPEGYSQIHADATYYNSVRERLMLEYALLTATLLISGVLLWYTYTRKAAQLPVIQKSLAFMRRIPLDIRIVLLFPIILIYMAVAFGSTFFSFPIGFEQFFTLTVMLPLTAIFLLYIVEAWIMYNDGEQLRQQWSRSLLSRQRSLLKESYSNRSVFFKVALIFTLTVGLGMSIALGLFAIADRVEELLILVFLYGMFYVLCVLPYIFRRIGLMNRLLLGASQMASGDLKATIVEKPRGKLADLAHSLNNIRQGLQHSVESQMKSERLKSELITNVSHDLKTPLTSIINYVDLLKRDNLTQDDIKSYVDVLERKTNRLKVLIDDLFEAAKTASGSVELNIEQVNVSALLNQAIAEFSDKIDESTLTFRVNIEQPKIMAPLDGKKTWRVFENLIGNALKYSMPNTRVHVHLTETQNEVVLTIKNVSAYEIDFAADELFERFKRADQSRNTEGSGLGLAIAKSIVELQGGKLAIDIDGDYFKVIVLFRR